jgi:hypothetical protein
MPEGQDLQSPGCVDEAVVEIVVNTSQVLASDARKRDVPGARADLRLDREQ